MIYTLLYVIGMVAFMLWFIRDSSKNKDPASVGELLMCLAFCSVWPILVIVLINDRMYERKLRKERDDI